MNKEQIQAAIEDAELQVEQAADQGDEEMAAYWDTKRQELEKELKRK